jgi:hypothetical protein
MNSKFIDSMLPKYGGGEGGQGNSAVNYSSAMAAAARMYPYVSMGQQSPFAAAAAAAALGGFGSHLGNHAGGDPNDPKSCRYNPTSVADSMLNYNLAANAAAGHNSAATAAGIAAAAQFYHQAAVAASGGDPMQCPQGGQGLPDIPRYPWMTQLAGRSNVFIYYSPHYIPYSPLSFCTSQLIVSFLHFIKYR